MLSLHIKHNQCIERERLHTTAPLSSLLPPLLPPSFDIHLSRLLPWLTSAALFFASTSPFDPKYLTILPAFQTLCLSRSHVQELQTCRSLSYIPNSEIVSLPHLSPDANSVSDVILAVGQLSDAVVHGDAALSRSQVFLCHLDPTQRAHCETLEHTPRP